MLVIRAALSTCVAFAGLAACEWSRTLNIRLPQNTPVEVSTWQRDQVTRVMQEKTVLLQPDAAEYHRLNRWVASNQRGWRKLPFEKGPRDGIFVTSGDLRFRFHLRSVTLSTKTETFYKGVREDEYAFLKPLVGF
jgi:hypothetical protein